MDTNIKFQKSNDMYGYAVLVVALILGIIFFYGGILPSIKSMTALQDEFVQKKGQLERRYQTAQENQRLSDEIAKIEKDFNGINRMLFSLDDISTAVKEIANISQDLQIEFMSLSPASAQTVKSAPEIGFSLWQTPISIKMKTSYSKLIQFIRRVENSGRFLKIEGFQIKKNPANLLVHEAQITLSVYSLQQVSQQVSQ